MSCGINSILITLLKLKKVTIYENIDFRRRWLFRMAYCYVSLNRGYEVLIVDDYSRKKIANDTNSQALIEGENMYERCEIFHHYYGKRINFKEQDLKGF